MDLRTYTRSAPVVIERVLTSIRFRTLSLLAKHSSRLPRPHVPQGRYPITALCVYRERNASNVLAMIQQLPNLTELRLHALDHVSEKLAPWTIASGPGARMDLLRALLEFQQISPDSWLAIFDDDTHFVAPGQTKFFDYVVAGGFQIAQPSIHTGNPTSHGSRHTHPLSTAREVGFVEVGPMVAFSPRAVKSVSIFPAFSKMGWGADVIWAQESKNLGLRMGVVDAAPVRHLGPIGVAYNALVEERILESALRDGDISWSQFMSSHYATWRPWKRRPPWCVA